MSFAWAIELLRPDGGFVCRVPVHPDWEPASLWVRFEGIRRGLLPPVLRSEPGRVEPVWVESTGAPYVSAFRVTIHSRGDGTEPVMREIPAGYLARQIHELTRILASAGKLEPGELVHPRVCAFPATRDEGPTEYAGVSSFTVEEIPQALSLVETTIENLSRHAEPFDLTEGDEDVPIFLPRSVLDETEALSREACEVETGGLLIGRLHRDPQVPEIFAEITAQIPARHTLAREARLTFTPETWAAARLEIDARGMAEELIGWWHFHPDFCRRCPAERRRECTLDSAFFSADDVSLHHLCFSQAHQVALLVSADGAGAFRKSLYGWRRGSVARRGFYSTEAGGEHEKVASAGR